MLGYGLDVGLQFVNLDWLRLSLQTMKAQGMSQIFDRLFFVSHLYGLNHPPAYAEDINGVLGFREFARIFKDEIGFIPVIIVVAAFAFRNAQIIRIDLFTIELHIPLAVVILVALFVGAGLGFLANLFVLLSQKNKIRKLMKQHQTLSGLSDVLKSDK